MDLPLPDEVQGQLTRYEVGRGSCYARRLLVPLPAGFAAGAPGVTALHMPPHMQAALAGLEEQLKPLLGMSLAQIDEVGEERLACSHEPSWPRPAAPAC